MTEIPTNFKPDTDLEKHDYLDLLGADSSFAFALNSTEQWDCFFGITIRSRNMPSKWLQLSKLTGYVAAHPGCDSLELSTWCSFYPEDLNRMVDDGLIVYKLGKYYPPIRAEIHLVCDL